MAGRLWSLEWYRWLAHDVSHSWLTDSAMKILLISNTHAPYRVPVFNAIQEQSPHEWVILFETRRLAHAPWEDVSDELTMRHVFLPDGSTGLWRLQSATSMMQVTQQIVTEERPDVVVLGGWNSPAVWMAWLNSRYIRRPIVLWSGMTQASIGHRTLVRNWMRRRIVRSADAHVAYSATAAEYLMTCGAASEAIFVGPNVGDVDFYSQQMRVHRPANRTTPNTIQLIYVGQLIPRKGLRELLTALAMLHRDDWHLRIIGSGPLREELIVLVSTLKLSHHVTFMEYLGRHSLAKQYAEADVFILPSLVEVGAIVNSEAIASGLYCLVSEADGVAPDLIEHGINGERVKVTDARAYAATIDRVLDKAKNGELDPYRINATAGRFSTRKYASAFLNAVQYAAERRGICTS
jgi:glycosyltransferase involved in cell wall biosynthesis